MDTGASSHLAENTGMLTSFSNPSLYKSVFVGNGQPIPVTHTGHSLLYTPHKPLHLHYVLVTPNIIKNLIFVRKFTRNNNVSVDFDAYGFSVKDYQTRRFFLSAVVLSGDLYTVHSTTIIHHKPFALHSHKYNVDGSLSRYKARLVANGRSQQQGIDCDETFSLVVKPTTIHTVLSLAITRDWPIHQLDVNNSFLYGQLSETVYMH
ncbi:ribonuclease H-like domain-containing protein [Tanacetum coccineum]